MHLLEVGRLYTADTSTVVLFLALPLLQSQSQVHVYTVYLVACPQCIQLQQIIQKYIQIIYKHTIESGKDKSISLNKIHHSTIHQKFSRSGSKILLTNTFSGIYRK